LLGLLEGDFDGQRRHSNKDGKLSEISNHKYIGYVYILPVILPITPVIISYHCLILCL
jgi:hypothetical protein